MKFERKEGSINLENKFQTSSEQELVKQAKAKSRLYKTQSDEHKSDLLSKDIGSKLDMLKNIKCTQRVDFNDVAAVQRRTYEYMEVCKDAGMFPTVMGLSAALGYSRRGLNKYLTEHDNSTTHFLESVKDNFADIMSNAALFRNADAATTIFILKNCAGFVDKIEIAPVQPNPLGDEPDPDEIAAKYVSMLPPEDD